MARGIKAGLFIVVSLFCFAALAVAEFEGPKDTDRYGDAPASRVGIAPDPEPEKKETPLYKREGPVTSDEVLLENKSKYLGTSHGDDD